jgi:Protein of unknown function (DUF3047)
MLVRLYVAAGTLTTRSKLGELNAANKAPSSEGGVEVSLQCSLGRRLFAVRLAAFLSATLALAGCASHRSPSNATLTEPVVPRFSAVPAGAPLPEGWTPWTFSRFKKETQYDLVDYQGRTVVRAAADASASGLIHRVRFDPREYPLVSWRWKVPALIEGADNTLAALEDSPVRVVVAFDGPVASLPPLERIAFTQFRALTGQTMPYATLMYIWENKQPRETLIASRHSSRVQMVVAESGQEQLGKWCEITRNVYEDYKRAFGTEPPPVKWIALMSDTDNTAGSSMAYYGDLEVRRDPRALRRGGKARTIDEGAMRATPLRDTQ